MRLVSITWRDAPGLVGLRPGLLQTVEIGPDGFATAPHQLKPWRFELRDESILLISPRGWEPSEAGRFHRDEPIDGERTVFEVPRSSAVLRWGVVGDAEIEPPATWRAPRIATADAVEIRKEHFVDATIKAAEQIVESGFVPPPELRPDPADPDAIVPVRRRSR